SYHAELHQYKHHIELFNQLTQKLIAVYQQDDTSKVKKMTETINQRYNNLNTSIINRGKLLHSAMNSLHNFDRSLDKFLAWLSEAESSMECVEAETDRLGGRRDPGLLRQPLHQLKKNTGYWIYLGFIKNSSLRTGMQLFETSTVIASNYLRYSRQKLLDTI
ncbi:hypothetical protein Cfor_05125, partial [Coptotermes formosanus]